MVCRRQNGELMVYIKPCTTCLMSPLQREDYQTGFKVFPLPFCGHRWIEDKKVADRVFNCWPNIAKYVNETLKKPKSKIPGSSSLPHLELLYRMPQ